MQALPPPPPPLSLAPNQGSPHEAGVESDAEERVVLKARVVDGEVGALEVLRHDRPELGHDHPLVLKTRRASKPPGTANGSHHQQIMSDKPRGGEREKTRNR